MLENMEALFRNKLFLQYLAAAGQDLGQGNAGAPNVNAVTMSNIRGQNYAKMLQQLLSGGGKVTMDAQSVNIKAPVQAFKDPGKDPGITGLDYKSPTNIPSVGGVPKLNLPKQTGPSSGADSMLMQLLMGNTGSNPSASPLGDFAPSDLAGLTPQDISQALQFKFAQTEQGRQAINDRFNNLYKMSLIKQGERQSSLAEAQESRLWMEALRTSPLTVPGIGKVPEKVWNDLPADVKAYSYYAYDAQVRGEDVMPFNEWKISSDPSSMSQIVKMAMEDDDFKKTYIDLKSASATKINIEGAVDKKRALGNLETEQYFTTGGGLAEDVGKYMDTEDVQNQLIQYRSGDDLSYKKEKAKIKAKFIERQIVSRLGKDAIINEEFDPETGIGTWVVKYKDGTVGTISHVIYD